MTLQDEYCRAHGDTLDGGPETFGFQFDQPFLLADADSNTLEIEISLVAGGRYAIRYREGSWPTGSAGAW
jgi:hypothetical protein